ncbi:ROK family glucokinase [Clostridium aestuarii]|uniref:Glucokinase n=1 Tax=Clostridium aestuarii TaxID=338193 RepID=A0ABT4D2K1_9CLOT|nr:ROK family glucokinase [Clostridium aestuarii]
MRIGIDLGGTNIAFGLVNEEGRIIYKKQVKTEVYKGEKNIVEKMVSAINEILENNSLTLDQIKSIGIGVPGVVDYDNGIVKECVNLNWKEVNLRELIKNKINKSVLLENDANAAAVGEYLCGSMKGAVNSILITLGTGVGGGLILNNKLFRGSNGAALEIGHIIIGENFYNCSCGNNGCFETFASATAIIKYAQKLIKEGNKSIIMEMVNNDVDKIDAKVVFDAAREDDLVANKVIDRFVKYLAKGINSIINFLDVDSIAIGGGVSAAEEMFLPKLKEEIMNNKLFKSMPLCEIKKTVLGNDAGIIGAAMLDRI